MYAVVTCSGGSASREKASARGIYQGHKDGRVPFRKRWHCSKKIAISFVELQASKGGILPPSSRSASQEFREALMRVVTQRRVILERDGNDVMIQ